MTIEVIINGRLIATKEVSDIKLRTIPYLTFRSNYTQREKIINSYLEEMTRQLKPVLKCYSAYQLEYRLTFQSKMNRRGFIIQPFKKEDKGFKQLLKTA
jgi:hypothetical protein